VAKRPEGTGLGERDSASTHRESNVKPKLLLGIAGCFGIVVLVVVAVVVAMMMRWERNVAVDPVETYVEAMRPIWDEGTTVRRTMPQDLASRSGREELDGVIGSYSGLLARARIIEPPEASTSEIHEIYLRVQAKRVELLEDLKSSAISGRTADSLFYTQFQATDNQMVLFNHKLNFIISDHELVMLKGGFVK